MRLAVTDHPPRAVDDGRSVPAELRAAADALADGRPVLVTGTGGPRDAPVEVLLAAATATTPVVAWMVRHSSGLLYAPMTAARAAALRLTRMTGAEEERGTVGRSVVSVDAAEGVSTGISAADRAHTAHVLADPAAAPTDLTRPGHVLPLVAEGAGFAATAVSLLGLCGLAEVGLSAALVDARGELVEAQAAVEVASGAGMPLVRAATVALACARMHRARNS